MTKQVCQVVMVLVILAIAKLTKWVVLKSELAPVIITQKIKGRHQLVILIKFKHHHQLTSTSLVRELLEHLLIRISFIQNSTTMTKSTALKKSLTELQLASNINRIMFQVAAHHT